ncbi:Uncharacterised protein [uncultured Clostridium sp.]|nr:Uncharacterised protein [uncultured Clostridium sp.]
MSITQKTATAEIFNDYNKRCTAKPLLMKSNPVEQLCHNSVLAEFKFNFHSYPQDFLC